MWILSNWRKRVRDDWEGFKRSYEREHGHTAGGLVFFAGFIPHAVDFFVRFRDFRQNRTYDGRLRKIGILGHAPTAFILPVLLLYLICFGPAGTLWRGWPALVCFVSSVLLLWALFRWASRSDSRAAETGQLGSRPQTLMPVLLLTVGGALFVFAIYLPAAGRAGTLWFVAYLLVVFALTLIGWLIFRSWNRRPQRLGSHSLWIQLAVLMAAGLAVWIFSDASARESDTVLYRHILVPLVFALLVLPLSIATITARIIVRRRISEVGDSFRHLLQRVEVFAYPVPPDVDWNKVLRSFSIVVLHPLQVLLPPSLMVLITPFVFRQSLPWVALITLVGTILMLAFAQVHGRLQHLVGLYKRTFFFGMQVAVSVVVILLGLARLADIGYVSYIVEASPLTLLMFVLTAYTLLWFFEYWVNRIIGEEVLALLSDGGGARGIVHYEFENDDAHRARVRAEGRRVQIHGGARLVAVGDRDWTESDGESWYTEQSEKREDSTQDDPQNARFQFFEKFELLHHLIDHAELKDFEAIQFPNQHATPSEPARKREKLRSHVRDLQRQFVSYYTILNLVLALGLILHAFGLTYATQAAAWPDPKEASMQSSDPAPDSPAGFHSLRERLFDRPDDLDGKAEPVVLLAASGGGTRAALYTASVLHGLASIGRLDAVQLASGVSGGGAALAYFAGHRKSLVEAGTPDDWTAFYQAVSSDFIVRCLEGSCEWRVAGGQRLGRLLDEGFEQVFFGGKSPMVLSSEIGLLFNTGLTGEAHRPDSSEQPIAEWASAHPELAHSWAAGTRLIFTNIEECDGLRDIQAVSRDGLRYVTVRDPSVRLSTAAALNANFPPVFSNGAVDVDGHRYWVTDGGSVDNRGLISLLYTLREALRNQQDLVAGVQEPSSNVGAFVYPEIHIVVADASATSFSYAPKRGFGAIFGASSKLASGLIEELLADVTERYARIAGGAQVRIHSLVMPLALRARGGLGTHWMMPRMARFNSCQAQDPAGDATRRLTRSEILRIIASLHQPKGLVDAALILPRDPFPLSLFASDAALEEVSRWFSPDAAYARGFGFTDDKAGDHASTWQAIVDQLAR